MPSCLKTVGWSFGSGATLGCNQDGVRIYGDGVNTAARLGSLAEAGGICISGTIFDHVKNKLNLGYEFRREQTVKNIAEPMTCSPRIVKQEVKIGWKI